MQIRLLGRGAPLGVGAIGLVGLASCTQDSGVKVYNTAPGISITAPPDGTEVDEGQVVTFEAFAQDDTTPAEALVVDWSSNLAGLISESMSPDAEGAVVFHAGSLAPGDHVITVNVLDAAAASGSDYISLTVFDVPDAPEIAVVHPVQGEYGVEGEPYVFVSMVSDEQDAADTLWVVVESDVEGRVCQSTADATGVATCEGQLSTGDHFLTFTVEDTDGYTAAETVAFEVRDGFSIDHDGDGQSEDEGDCDDRDPSIYDGAEEFQNGVDDDCDGETDEGTLSYDDDGDCHCEGLPCLGSIEPACGALSGDDCDDADATVSPAAPELCDSVDNDCDGEVDEDDAADAATWHVDLDSDGFGDPSVSHDACSAPFGYVADDTDCDDSRASVNPVGTEVCNGLDDDCDGAVDDGVQSTFWRDQDGDGHGDALRPQLACNVLSGFSAVDDDCDDTDTSVSPSATEYCNSIDDNCDGTVDEATAADAPTWYGDGDGDGYGNFLNPQVSCAAPSGFGADNSDCNDANAAIYPGALEYCDGVDNNCDGTVDESTAVDASIWYTDLDSDGFGDPGNVLTACWQSPGTLLNAADCDDTNSAIYPGATEVCDAIDNDCDGQVDDADSSLVGGSAWFMDADGDGQGNPAIQVTQCSQPFSYVANDQDCNDASAAAWQGATEVCGDSIDNDCDGATDEGCTTYVNVSTSPNAPVYDYNTTVSTLAVSGCNNILSLSMPLTLYHTYQGDLIINLVGPSGTTVNLWNGQGGTTNNIITFSPTAFNGQTGNGTWALSVYDRYYYDSGTLASWGLNLTCN